MNTRPMHHLFADDLWSIGHGQLSDEEKAILCADYTKADRNEGAGLAIPHQPFGGCDCSLGLVECQCMCRPIEAASAVSGVEQERAYRPREDQTESADAVLFGYFATVLLALFTAWCIANYLAAANV